MDTKQAYNLVSSILKLHFPTEIGSTGLPSRSDSRVTETMSVWATELCGENAQLIAELISVVIDMSFGLASLEGGDARKVLARYAE